MGMGIRGGGAAREIQALLDGGAVGTLEDGELLGRFLGRDHSADSAFAALVDRHGRMVLRVCRDVLGDPHEAQDAAQATFFILARKAAAIRKPEALPSWLHGTARRVASRALRESIRRRKHERRSAEVVSRNSDSESPRGWPELHEELAKLPDRYREPIVLCDLTGLTHEQAAGKLGCPPRTLETRLYRGRERLKDRLVRRGVAPSAALVGVAWATEARASMPQNWVGSTASAAVRLAGKRSWAAAGDVPANAVRLAREHLKEMTMIKLKWVAAAGILVGAAGGGAWSRMVPEEKGRQGDGAIGLAPRVVEVAAPTKPKDPFEQAYTLADGEDVKALTGAAIEARNEHYRGKGNQIGISRDPATIEGPVTVFYRWRADAPMWTSTVMNFPQKLRELIPTLAGVQGQEVEGDAELLDTPLPADYLVREGARAESIIPQLETILRRDFHLPARLSLRDEAQDVVVVRGHYKYQASWKPREFPDHMTSGGDRIEVYADKLGDVYNPRKDPLGSGKSFSDLLSDVSQFIGRRVINEAEKGPKTHFDYCITDGWAKKKLSPEERALTLKHLANQTDLSFTEENRKVRVLRVEKGE
jgi:RNA polymerase sigma factor (sigma-70 family)